MIGNMVANVCVKFNYDRLRINKALGIFENLITSSKWTAFVPIGEWGPLPGPKINTAHQR